MKKEHERISFLDQEQSAAAIIDDSLEPYFNQLQPMEMAAKTGAFMDDLPLEQQRQKCRERYSANVLNFSAEEQIALRFFIDALQPVLLKNYPLFGKMPWSFMKTTDSIEGGLPHTRGQHILFSESFCDYIVRAQQFPQKGMSHIKNLLVHEQMHVFQRTHPNHFDSLYEDLWGFVKVDTLVGCEWLDQHRLANPDAVDCRWILPVTEGNEIKYLCPLLVFSEGNSLKKMPDDFHMLAISVVQQREGFAVELENNGRPVYRDLNQSPEFRVLFPMSTNIYHPHEASADMFAKIVIFDHFLPEIIDKKNQQLAPLRNWFKKNL
jgi:hypothetical protein